MRCALRTIRLAAVWRKISVEAHDRQAAPMRSGRPAPGPGPIEGSWSTSPTRSSARLGAAGRRASPGTAAGRPSTSRRRPGDRRSAGARRRAGSRGPARPRAGGGGSLPRARCSRRAAARRARSAPRAGRRPPARRGRQDASTSVVLPVPGPPVITRSLLASAVGERRALGRREAQRELAVRRVRGALRDRPSATAAARLPACADGSATSRSA